MQLLQDELRKTRDLFDAMLGDTAYHKVVTDITERAIICLQQGGKILFAGNGGSAADAQHLAAELVSKLCFDRPGLPGLAITTDSSALTAIGNDYGYERLFARQVEALGNPGDMLWCFSTSGRSANILAALQTAQQKELATVGLSGASGGDMPPLCDYMIHIPSYETPKIQEGHIATGHIICAAIEERLFADSYRPASN